MVSGNIYKKIFFLFSVPPNKVFILNDKSEMITRPMIGPCFEGDTIKMTCVTTGGNPLPKVTWWLENTIVDDTYETISENRVANELVIDKITREHSGNVYTCRSVNNNVLPPPTADVKIDMYCKCFFFLFNFF